MRFDAPDREPTIQELAERRKRKMKRKAREIARRIQDGPSGSNPPTVPSEVRHCARPGCRSYWEATTRRRDARFCGRGCKDRLPSGEAS